MLRLLSSALLIGCCALAQTTSTQIVGVVTDSSGAAVTGATVEASGKATGEKRVTQSNETGNYALLNIESGEYELQISASGFRPERNGNFKHADRGYRGQFGDRHFYREQYRAAYMQGYRQGYGNGGYGNGGYRR